ncbi:MAG: hypothetical protein IID03_09595 [Candidatus Dadabacteria bacterium]|nr:hypothetical protein [Candidatus Dadabacteria bacterium]
MDNKLRGSHNNLKPGVDRFFIYWFDISWLDFPDINWGGIVNWFDWK